MKTIEFRKFRLFKSDEIFPLRKKKEVGPQEKISWFKQVLNSPYFYIIVFAAIISFFISYFPARPLPSIKLGEIAAKDIISPLEITVEDSQATERRKEQAEATISPVYFYNQKILSLTREKIKQFFETGRGWQNARPALSLKDLQRNLSENLGLDVDETTLKNLARLKFPPEIEQLLAEVLTPILSREIILSRSLLSHGEPEKGLLVVRGKEEKLLRAAEVLELREARSLLASEIEALELPARTRNILKALAPVFLVPTINYDAPETEIRRLKARNQVEPVYYTIKKGKVIIRKGDEATPEAIRQIAIINQKISSQVHWLINFAGLLVLYSIIFFFIWNFIGSVSGEGKPLRLLQMMGLTIFLGFVAYKASLFIADALGTSFSILNVDKEALTFGFPFQFGTFIFAILTRSEIAIVYAVFNSLLAGYLLNGDYFQVLFVLLGGIAVIYGLRYYLASSRSSTLKTGLMVLAPFQVILVLAFHLVKQSFADLANLGTELLSAIFGGLLSAAIAYVLMPVFETLFGFITATKLHELTNSDLPIFRQLALEAPGTYHHSLIVATLAEKAAEKINANAALVKAGGLYHDLGKIRRPEYFGENQTSIFDAHRELTPSLSTLVIVNHVKDGIDLARKLKLPRQIVDLIAQHHGTSIVRYFFQKAKEKYDPDLHKIEAEDYRYPGPTPKSKEAGLLLLADSVEAAARSLNSPTRQNLKRVITEIFNSHLQDGQLDDCGFSLRDLRVIANSFLTTLDAIYHPRPKYPGFDFEKKIEKKEENKKNNGRNNKQAEDKPDSSGQD
ncbi:MAG: HDIG domain-containing protein [Candidatus Aminicenantes bacterium]|nr:HDIG domain-containing protein [Candidatus Aminicenantes bacterium]